MEEVLKGKRVSRLDSISLDGTYFTPEGYLVDRPILTSCGIFEYRNPDGSIRRELRLPEHVFDEESLKSYCGKPVIITHNAGKVTKDNVSNEIVGTIISAGYQDGQDVRAEIIIHDVNNVKNCGMRELSLGYDLELVEQPGIWNGQNYDAIQINIRVNHLALVKKARAGDQAHLNMDHKDSISDDKKYLKGGKRKMSKITHRDAMLSPEDFAASIEAYKAKKEELAGTQAQAPAPEETPAVVPAEGKDPENQDVKPTEAPAEAPVIEPEVKPVEAPAEPKPEEGNTAPKDLNEALKLIDSLMANLQTLQETIDKMQAEKDIANSDDCMTPEHQEDGACTPAEVPVPQATQAEQPIMKKEEEKPMNMDSIDAIVSQKLELGKIGQKLNLDGLETMEIKEAQKKVIMAVKPGMRLDGKSDAYIDAAYEMARDIANEMKTTNDQRQQMANSQRLDGMGDEVKGPSCTAYEARQKLINRRENRE